MSQRPTASHPQPSSPLDHRPSVSSSVLPLSQTVSFGPPITGSSYSTEYGTPLDQNSSASSLPPLQQRSGAAAVSVEQRSSRSLGVHSILNPTQVEGASKEQSQTRDTDTGPSRVLASPRDVHSSVTELPQGKPALGQALQFRESISETILWDREPRRILTPRSPTSRAAGLGHRSFPRATIDARKSPFLTSRTRAYAVEAGAAANPETLSMPTPPSASRYPYSFPPPAPTPPLQIRSMSGGAAPPPHSQSASPATSYSSYSQLSHTSPAPRFHLPSSQPALSQFQAPFSTGGSSGEPQLTLASESPFGPATTTMGQSYQLMTFDTDQGPIQVPVDVQAASKMADEKRKRNAGASARFRQRRKEKEKEASHLIAKLEQQIRESNEERDFYKRERDYFRGFVYSSSIQAQVIPRPPSPRQRRLLPTSRSSTSAGGWQRAESRAGEMSRITRRRTGAYAPPFALPPPSTSSSPLPQGYVPPASFQPSFSDSRPILGGRPSEPRTTGLPPPNRSFDPFQPEGYDRSWNPGR
ncbi:hypothetical protein MMC16_005655 [Acarospora aff. strigata]|nr:hypothetical protein [Acarospora aff. strigata]